MTVRLTETLTYWTARIGCATAWLAMRAFPRRSLYWLSDLLAKVGFHICRDFRSRSMSNIQLAFGPQLSKAEVAFIARRSLRNFLRACVETGIALESSDKELSAKIPVLGREHLEAAQRKGKGVIVLSAHLGNFCLAACRLAIDGYSTYVVINQPRNARCADLMDQYRRLRVRERTIHARPRHQALQTLTAVLRRGEVAVILADEYRKGSGIRVPLFGKAVIARRGPVTLALRTGAAVVPVCMVRRPDDSLQLIIEPELELERSGKGKAEIQENTLRLTKWLERTVRTYPDQWNWMNIRWYNATHEFEHATNTLKVA